MALKSYVQVNCPLRKIIVALVAAAVLLVALPNLSLAAGVPVYQYDIAGGTISGYASPSNYDWAEIGYPWSFYYKVVGYSPWLSEGYYYAGNMFLKSVQGQTIIQGFDGSQWLEITRLSTWNGYYERWETRDYTVNLPFRARQIRYVTWVGVWCGEYRSGFVSINSQTYYVYLIGADQDTAQAAYNAANAARSSADAAAARVWDGAEGKSAATLAKEARDKANQALTAINNLQATVNNIQSSVGPQILKVRGLNGATATRTNTFSVTVEAANATEFRAKVDGGTWSAWTPVSSPLTLAGFDAYGAHTVYVEVRNASGATSAGQMTAFRL